MQELRIAVNELVGEVSACLMRPRNASWLYVMAHGAGAGMHHAFPEDMAERLGTRKVATLRFQFPYTEAGRKRPDHQSKLMLTVRAALDTAQHKTRLPVVAGGKSMGGRMTSLALAEHPDAKVRGVAFLGFPLHAPGRVPDEPTPARAAHLHDVSVPMLFVQGTRDSLADIDRMRALVQSLGPRATLHVVQSGDHSFKVLKRSGRTRDQVMDEVADAVAAWGQKLVS